MIARWMDRPVSVSPFLDTAALLRELGALHPQAPNRARGVVPAADLFETADGLTLRMDVPGHDPQGIEVKVEGNTLTVRSERKEEEVQGQYLLRERRSGAFSRTFVLPEAYEPGRVEASFHDGVLTLSVPRREEAKPRTIKVNVVNGRAQAAGSTTVEG